MLADLLRTDQARLQLWRPDSLLTRQLRAKVGWLNHLTRETTRLGNRLRAVLGRYYPAALQVFRSLVQPVTLQFVRAFPTPAGLQALAGTCPVTRSSGKSRTVLFRKACDHDFRQAAQQWALASLRTSAWAQAYWQQTRPHCHSDSHAYRCLANRWLAVAWKLWQTRQPYDEDYHLQQRLARSRPRVPEA